MFNILNLYGITSIIQVFEILFLNSIKRPFVRGPCPVYAICANTLQQAIGSHLFGLIFSAGMYIGWAAIGKLITGWYAFDWLDVNKVGSEEAVTAYCIGFVILAPLSECCVGHGRVPVLTRAVYILMQGFVGIREGLTRARAESRAAAQQSEESLEG